MTKHPLFPPPTPPTPAEEALDRALDALVLGDSGVTERMNRLDPDLRSTVEEVYLLADLGGFAREAQHARTAPQRTISRRIPWANARWTRTTALIAAAALLLAVAGVSVLIAVQDSGRDPQPAMIAAGNAAPTPGSTRELIELPASTRPLTVATGETLAYGGMAAGYTSVFRLLATPEFTGVEAVDAETETVAWRLATAWSSAGICAGASGVYAVTDPNQLIAIDPATGGDLWQVSFGAPIVSMALQDADPRDDVLYVWDESSTMTAIDTATGDPLWQTATSDPGGPQATTGQTTPGMTPAIGAEVVVMVAANGMLNAFDRSTGEIAWSTPGFDGIHARIAIEVDRLMVVSTSSDAADGAPNLIGTGLDLASGTVDWQIGISGPLLQPAGSEDTFFYVVADTVVTYPDGSEIAPQYVDYAGCCADWAVSEGANASPGKGVNGGTHIFGIDTTTGTVIWSRSTRAGAFITAKTIFPQSGSLFAVTSDSQLIWLQRETGGILPEPMDLGGQIVEFIPFSVDMVRYVITMADGSMETIRRTQPPG